MSQIRVISVRVKSYGIIPAKQVAIESGEGGGAFVDQSTVECPEEEEEIQNDCNRKYAIESLG